MNALQHEGLVHKVARSYRWACGTSLDYDDLLQAGRMGVLRALEKYDPAKGRPSTYVTLWIRDAIVREVRDNSRTIRVPDHVWRKNALPPAVVYGVDLESIPEPENDAEPLNECAAVAGFAPSPTRASSPLRPGSIPASPSRVARAQP